MYHRYAPKPTHQVLDQVSYQLKRYTLAEYKGLIEIYSFFTQRVSIALSNSRKNNKLKVHPDFVFSHGEYRARSDIIDADDLTA